MKKVLVLFLAVITVLCLVSCGGNGDGKTETLEEITAAEIPEENETAKITINGFDISICSTYAIINGYKGDETEIVIPDNATGVPVKVIGESAFDGNTSITSVTFGSKVKKISRYAFRGTTNLKSVIMNDGLETIGDWAFYQSGIISLSIPDTVCVIQKYAFQLSSLESVKLPNAISRPEKYAFADCKNLKEVIFGGRITTIEDNLFTGCTSLVITEIPSTVTKIGAYAFRSCTSLKSVKIPSTVETVSEGAFYGCKDLTIQTKSDSAADKYAKKNSVTVEYYE